MLSAVRGPVCTTHSMCVRLPNVVDDLGGGIAHPVCILSTQLREESPQGVMS